MADKATDVPGAAIRTIRGRKYVVVQVSKMFPGPPPTVYGLAVKLGLQKEQIFQEILHFKSNVHMVPVWYRDKIGGLYPGLGKARRKLKQAGHIFTASDKGGAGIYVSRTPYEQWGVEPLKDRPVVFSLSSKFRSVMKKATAERKRQARIRAVAPNFKQLENQLKNIKIEAIGLDGHIRTFNSFTKTSSKELALLEALDGLLGAMLHFPKEKWDSDDKKEVESLRKKLAHLKAEAYKHLLHDPPDAFLVKEKRKRDQSAKKLVGMIENTTFLKNVKAFDQNRDIVPAALHDRAYETARTVYQVLLASPQCDHVLSKHVEETLQYLAAQKLDLTGCKAPNRPSFEKWVKTVPAPPAPTTFLTLLAGQADMTSKLVGNVPGPSSLTVAIFQFATPLILARTLKGTGTGRVEEASKYAAWFYRAIMKTGGMRAADRIKVMEAIDKGDLKALKKIDYTQRFMSGPVWGGAIAILSGICLMAAIRSDDSSTLRYWSNIIGSASGLALGVSVAVSRYSALVSSKIVAGIGGRALGVIGGVAAAVSGTVTAIEQYEMQDDVGMWLGIATATSGAFSAAGFMIAAGASTAYTGIGLALMAAGVILGIGAGIASLVRGLTTASTHEVFKGAIEHFGRSYGPYVKAAKLRPSFKKAFEAVQVAHHPGFIGHFEYVHPDKIPQLSDLGFKKAHIARMVDEEESLVAKRLKKAKRPTD